MSRSGVTGGGSRGPHGEDRAQAYTLEGVLGALLIVIALLASMQVVVLTPATAGTVGDSVRAPLNGEVRSLLAAAATNGSLSRSVRYWNDSRVERTFAGGVTPTVGYGSRTPPTGLGRLLRDHFTSRGYHVNVFLTFIVTRSPPTWGRITFVYQGRPSDSAVAASRPVTLFDDDPLTGPRSANATVASANRSGAYPIPDVAPNGSLYNTVDVRVVVW